MGNISADNFSPQSPSSFPPREVTIPKVFKMPAITAWTWNTTPHSVPLSAGAYDAFSDLHFHTRLQHHLGISLLQAAQLALPAHSRDRHQSITQADTA